MESLRSRARHRSGAGDKTLSEFFKVFMPQTSSSQLRIPKDFTKFLSGIMPNPATLVDHDRNSWDIGLEKIQDRLVFRNGWQKFAREKCLEQGDFLVFEYNGKSTFYVKIFSKTGCRKEAANYGKIAAVPIVILDDDSESDQGCRDSQQRKHTRTHLEKSDAEGPCRRSRSKSKRAYQNVKDDCEKAPEPAEAERVPVPLKNKKPRFVKSLTNWTLDKVEVPGPVLREWNIELNSKMSLRDENDKLWPVMMKSYKNHRHYFGDGWSDFRKSKNIEEGHRCEFEFVIGEANLTKEVLVRIYPSPSNSKSPNRSQSLLG